MAKAMTVDNEASVDPGASGEAGAGDKRGYLCASCDGYLDGSEPDWVCEPCTRQWETWHRNDREAHERWVEKRMRQTIGEVVRDAGY